MKKYLFLLLLLVASHGAISQPLISFETITSGLNQPVDIEEVNDSTHRLFIVEQSGTIRIWNGTSVSTTPFLNVASLIAFGGEQGLLSLAFHPDYLNNGYFFIYYTNLSGNITIARYSRSTAETADPASGVVLMSIPKPYTNHNGGNLVFGPDKYLYFGTGDGGSGGDPLNNAQNDTSLLGKMLRIDVNNPNPPYYNIPPTNPFAGSSTVKQEIIAKGLRNPWRWSFDKQTGDMWIADVGQNLWEEINIVKSGDVLNKNYGWRCYEGTHSYNDSGCIAQPNNVFPIFEYPHDTSGGASVTGGYVYRGNEYASLQGYYICIDFLSANGWLINPDGNGGWNVNSQKSWPAQISSFGETANGTLYALSISGTLYKVVANNSLPVHLISFSGRQAGNNFEINWQVQAEETGDVYIVERKESNAAPFAEVSKVVGAGNISSNNYSVKVPLATGQSFYRLKIISKNGSISYSQVIRFNGISGQMLRTFITGTNLMCKLPAGTTMVELFDAVGKSLLKQATDATATQVNISLANVPKGIITVRAFSNNDWQIARVLY